MKRALELASAPDDLLAWIDDAGNDADAWDGATQGDWVVWMASSIGIPLDDVVVATCLSLRVAVRPMPRDKSRPMRRVIRLVREQGDATRLERAISKCEGLAGPRDTYRTATPEGEIHAARAAVLLGRAFEALRAGMARDEAERLRDATSRAALLGVPPIMLQSAERRMQLVPERINDDPVQQELAYVVAATAHAAEEAALALADHGDLDALEDAQCKIADKLHELLSPLRNRLI